MPAVCIQASFPWGTPLYALLGQSGDATGIPVRQIIWALQQFVCVCVCVKGAEVGGIGAIKGRSKCEGQENMTCFLCRQWGSFFLF